MDNFSMFQRLLVILTTVIFVLGSTVHVARADVLRSAWQFDGLEPKEVLMRLDPAYSFAEKNIVILVDLFEPLLYSTFKGLQPAGAKKWYFSDDGKTLFFELDASKRWSDGKPVTAHDFVFSYQRLAIPEIAEHALDFITSAIVGLHHKDNRPIGVEALSDHKFALHLTAPYAIDLATFSHPMLSPMPRHIAKGQLIKKPWASWTHPVSNGPYSLEAIENGLVKLTRNPYFLVRDSERVFEKVEHYHIGWAETAKRFIDKDIDIINRVPPNQYQWLDRIKFHKHFATTYSAFLVLNKKYGPLKDERVRQALNLALDREALAKGLDGRFGKPSYGLIPNGFMGYSRTAKGDNQSRFAMARKLMEEAGFSDKKKLPLVLSTYAYPYHQRIYDAVSINWLSIYVDLKLKIIPSHQEQWEKNLAGDYQVTRRGWNPDFQSPRAYLNTCESSEVAVNCGYFKNPKFNQALARASNEPSQNLKLQIFRQAEDILLDEYTVIPLASRDYPVLISERIDISRLEPFSRPRSILIRRGK